MYAYMHIYVCAYTSLHYSFFTSCNEIPSFTDDRRTTIETQAHEKLT